MKNEMGLIRSGEMMKSKGMKMPKAVMSHMTVHPKMGGGVMVTHHHTSPMHPNKEFTFSAQDGAKFGDHMMKQTGMSWEPEEGTEAEAGNMGAQNQVDHAGA